MRFQISVLLILFCLSGFSQEVTKTSTLQTFYIPLQEYKKMGNKLTLQDSLDFRFHAGDTLVKMPPDFVPQQDENGYELKFEAKPPEFMDKYKEVVFWKDGQNNRLWEKDLKMFLDPTIPQKHKIALRDFAAGLSSAVDSLNIFEVQSAEDANFHLYYTSVTDTVNFDPNLKNTLAGYYLYWDNEKHFERGFVKVDTETIENPFYQLANLKSNFFRSLGMFGGSGKIKCDGYLSTCDGIKNLTATDMEILKYHYSYAMPSGMDKIAFEEFYNDIQETLKKDPTAKIRISTKVLIDQQGKYGEADFLRGSLRAERAYDVLKYHLKVKVIPEEKFISGFNTISFRPEQELPVMQIDLFENMRVDSIIHQNKKLKYQRKHNAVFVKFEEPLIEGVLDSVRFYYSGNPVIAANAPWDGGFVFEEDQEGNPWIAVAVQGTGASLWYPNKDHQSDEPEEVLIEAAVPNGLMNVSNGRFVGQEDLGDGYTRWSWKVTNPINNYNIVLNIGNYVHFKDSYKDLDLDYYVLPYNLEKAKLQFEEVKPMMKCFYEKFGEYPFVEDGYKLVETPYLGMEHQSAVAYGNKYRNGYLGNDLSGTGIGLRFDFIIIHESGHEWYGNSITANDIADMWIHEGFTAYSESVYIECRWGKEDALQYLKGTRRGIGNDSPIIGDYGVNSEGSGDMYYKGSNLLNTIRSIYNDDKLWWKTLKDYTETYKHQNIITETTEAFFDKATKTDLQPIFDQYLRHSEIPELQFKKEGNEILYRWKTDVENFEMPVDVFVKEIEIRLNPTSIWQKLPGEISIGDLKINIDEFYIDTDLHELQ